MYTYCITHLDFTLSESCTVCGHFTNKSNPVFSMHDICNGVCSVMVLILTILFVLVCTPACIY